jgi:MSHA biogenesis protein MshM
MLYLDHFGLKKPPFRITPDPGFFYSGAHRGDVLAALVYAVTAGEGIVKVVGEVGSGKTMLCRMLELELADQVDIVYLANPSLSPDNIAQAVAFELGLPTEGLSRLEVMQRLQSFLLERHASGHNVVVFIEEAQGMPLATLEELRLLSNLETADHKLLQIVLFGQPELDINLRETAIRQLRERITHSFELQPLQRADTHGYLNFRMRAAGYRGPDLFTPRVARQIARYSQGLIRRINILADKCLLAAYAAGTHAITTGLVRRAARDLDPVSGSRPAPWLGWLASAVIAAIVAVVVTWQVVTVRPVQPVQGTPGAGAQQSGSSNVAGNKQKP